MCGLWGATSNYMTPYEVDNVLLLAMVSVIRGTDSAGLARVNHRSGNHRTTVLRQVTNSAAMASNPGIRQQILNFEKDGELITLLGHSRAATLGKINKENAHPFVCDHIIGAHNGTVDRYVKKKSQSVTVHEKGKMVTKVIQVPEDENDNDSRILFQKIAKNGLRSVVDEINEIGGAYALSWIDTKEKTLNLIRNGQRPLYTALSADKSTVYWCSSEDILNTVRNRGTSVWAFGPSKQVPIHTLIKVPFGEKAGDRLEEIPFAPTPKPIVHPVMNQHQHRRCGGSDKGKPGGKFLDIPFENDYYHLEWTGFHYLFKKTEEEAKVMLSRGCIGCKHVSDPWAQTYWLSDKEYMCDDCSDDSFMKEYVAGKRLVKSFCSWVL